MKQAGLIAVLVFFLSSASVAATDFNSNANPRVLCGSKQEIVEGIEKKYGETLFWIGVGVVPNSGDAELWLNQISGSWTLISSWPKGFSCVMASGFRSEFMSGIGQPIIFPLPQ